MPEDLYSQWLDVAPGPRPPDHYTLLGLPVFCGDASAIEQAARTRLARLDRYAIHPDPAKRDACHRLMNEVARARVVLVSPARKQRYDGELAVARGEPGADLPQADAGDFGSESEVDTESAAEAYLQDLTQAAQEARERASFGRRQRRQTSWAAPLLGLISFVVVAIVGWLVVSKRAAPTASVASVAAVHPAVPKTELAVPAPRAEPAATEPQTPKPLAPPFPKFSKRVTFVCDLSESMRGRLPALEEELIRTIQSLRVGDATQPLESLRWPQAFTIIAYGGGRLESFPPSGWVAATPGTKAAAIAFVTQLQAGGGVDDPGPALRRALGDAPDLLYLLTSGAFADTAAVRAEVGADNASRRTRINGILYPAGANPDPPAWNLLQAIAREHGGVVKFTAPRVAAVPPDEPLRKINASLNQINEWTVEQGVWDFIAEGKLRGEGASDIDFDPDLPPNATISFRMCVEKGMRPRIRFDGPGIYVGNEGYSKKIQVHGKTKDLAGDPLDYKNGDEIAVRVSFIGDDHFEVHLNDHVLTGTCLPHRKIHLRLSGGDWWSKGTTDFWDMHVTDGLTPEDHPTTKPANPASSKRLFDQ
jgi:hypothetical protein